jgi:hypothetical protein
MGLYLHSPIRLYDVVLNQANGKLCLHYEQTPEMSFYMGLKIWIVISVMIPCSLVDSNKRFERRVIRLQNRSLF